MTRGYSLAYPERIRLKIDNAHILNERVQIMKIKKSVIAVPVAASVLLITILTGCETRNAQEEVRSVEWYESNAAERTAKLADCMTNPRTLDATPDCVNASRAENNVKASTKWETSDEGVRTTPPITQ